MSAAYSTYMQKQRAKDAFRRSQSNLNPVHVQVGDGVTYGVGSDRYAATIQKISPSGKTVYFTDDNTKAGEGHDYFGHQVWEYETTEVVDTVDPVGGPVTNLKSARWDSKVQGYKFFGRVLCQGRDAHQDPSF